MKQTSLSTIYGSRRYVETFSPSAETSRPIPQNGLLLMQVNAAVMVKNLPPRLRGLLMARGTHPQSAGSSSARANRPVAAIAAADDNGRAQLLRRARTEDGRNVKPPTNAVDIKEPLLHNGHDSHGSPHSA